MTVVQLEAVSASSLRVLTTGIPILGMSILGEMLKNSTPTSFISAILKHKWLFCSVFEWLMFIVQSMVLQIKGKRGVILIIG